jgi:hypothetical protein
VQVSSCFQLAGGGARSQLKGCWWEEGNVNTYILEVGYSEKLRRGRRVLLISNPITQLINLQAWFKVET